MAVEKEFFGRTYNSRGVVSQSVQVDGIASAALEGIVKAIESTSRQLDDLNQNNKNGAGVIAGGINNLNDDNAKRAEKDRLRSLASERNSRAANLALNNKIDKTLSAIDILKNTISDCFDKLLDMVGDLAKQSLRSYDDNTKAMRKQFLTTEQIQKNLLLGDKAKEALSKMGIEVNSNETKTIITQLAESSADTSDLSDKQIAAITMMNKTMGTDVKTALALVKTSKDPEEIIKMAVQASDITGRETTAKLMQSVNESWFARYAQQVGGTEKAISEFQKAAKNLDASLGNYGLGADSQKGLIETAVKISSGQIEKVKSDEIANMLAISGDAMKSPEKLVEGIQNMITRTDLTKEKKLAKLRVLDGVEGINQEFITSLQNAIVANDNGEYKQKTKRKEEENIDAINQAQQGGRFGGFIDSVMTKINTATSGIFGGGIFGSLSANINEMFGDNLSMENIVTGGFKTVVSLLKAIALSKIIGNPLGTFTNIGKFLINPATIAAAAAAASVGYAAYKVYDTNERLNRPDEVKKDIAANNNEIAETESQLEAAKKYGTSDDIKQIEAKLASLKAKGESLKADLEQANEDAKSESEKNFDKYSTEQTEVMKGFIDEANLAQRTAMRARQAGDEETYKKEMARHAALMEQADKTREQMRIVNEESRGLLASTFNLSPETMLSWRKFKDTISNFFTKSIPEFFTKSIPEFFTETIPNALKTAGNWVWDKVLGAGKAINVVFDEYVISPLKSAWVWLDENVLTPVSNFFSDIATWFGENIVTPVSEFVGSIGGFINENIINPLNENFISPLSEFFDSIGDFIDENFISPLNTFFEFDWLPEPVKKVLGLKDSRDKDDDKKEGNGGFISSFLDSTSDINDLIKLFGFADGGVVDKTTPAVVGEAGKEAIIPLERPDDMKNVLNSLSKDEKLSLIKALLNNGTSITWDTMSEALLKVLGIGNSTTNNAVDNLESLKANTLASNIIAGAAAQKGHSYAEMVCNQMVEAALKYAGFTPPTTGVVTKHFNHPKMHIVLNDPVKGINPNDPSLIPGMIMFSHPFTQAEADQLNMQKGGRRKAGDPGHMGIYAGDGLWWNSTSSKKFKDYSTGKAVDSTASGVALTKPFTTGKYKLYAAGYYEGMFDNTDASALPSASKDISPQDVSQISSDKSTIKKSGLLTNDELAQIAKEAGITNAFTMSEFAKQADTLLSSNAADKESIIAILTDIARFLKGAITKQPMMSVNRPAASVYH